MPELIESLEARALFSAAATVLAADLGAVQEADAQAKSSLTTELQIIAADVKAIKDAVPHVSPKAQKQLLNALKTDGRAATAKYRNGIGAIFTEGGRASRRFGEAMKGLDAHPSRPGTQKKLEAAPSALQGALSDQALASLQTFADNALSPVSTVATAIADAVPAAQAAVNSFDGDLASDTAILASDTNELEVAVDTLAADVAATPTPWPTSPSPTSSPSGTAAYIATDAADGEWMNTSFGSAGQFIAGLASNLPAYASVTTTAGSPTVFPSEADPGPDLENPSGGTVAAQYSNPTTFDVSLNLTDGKTHQVAVDLADFDNLRRVETVQALGSGDAVLSQTVSVSDFGNGDYVLFDVSGSVTFRFAAVSGGSAVFSGLFVADATNVSLNGTITAGYLPLETPTGTELAILGPSDAPNATGNAGDMGAVTARGTIGAISTGPATGGLTLTSVDASPAGSDTVEINFTGPADPDPFPPSVVTYYIVGGTGKFADATGTGTIDISGIEPTLTIVSN